MRKKAKVGKEVLYALGQWGTYIIIYYVANYVVKVMVEIKFGEIRKTICNCKWKIINSLSIMIGPKSERGEIGPEVTYHD